MNSLNREGIIYHRALLADELFIFVSEDRNGCVVFLLLLDENETSVETLIKSQDRNRCLKFASAYKFGFH